MRIRDSSTYLLTRSVLHLPAGSRLRIEAGPDECPVVRGTILLRSSCRPDADGGRAGSEEGIPRVELVGLWWEGQIQLQGRLDLELQHCTLRPPPDTPDQPVITPAEEVGTSACASPRYPEITIQSCVLGPLRLPRPCRLVAADSVLDGGGGAAIAPSAKMSEGDVELDSVTVLGAIEGVKLKAISCLLAGPVHSTGKDASAAAYSVLGQAPEPRAQFVSRIFGDPGYARLDPTPLLRGDREPSVLTAAEDGCESGAFRRSDKVWRVANLQTAFEEYLPLGLRTHITTTLGLANTDRYLAPDSTEDDDDR